MTGEAERFVSASDSWAGGWSGPCFFRRDGTRLVPVDRDAVPRGAAVGHLPGTVLPGFTDSHVHLGLVDRGQLVAGGIARVVDLGGEPRQVARWRAEGDDPARGDAVSVEFAGAFLTAPGGYPTGRGWAPAESIREVSTNAESGAAIAEMAGLGATRIKIALNSEAGPVWADDLLAAVVSQAHSAGLPAVAHAQGPGQATRAVLAGVDTLAHTPWTERLPDDDIALAASRSSWTSTLDIHGWGRYGAEFEIAADNLGRFAAAGGRVLYGTDLGNGPLPVGLNVRELRALDSAGLGLDALVAALVPSAGFGPLISWIPDSVPRASVDAVTWLSAASVLPVTSIEESLA